MQPVFAVKQLHVYQMKNQDQQLDKGQEATQEMELAD